MEDDQTSFHDGDLSLEPGVVGDGDAWGATQATLKADCICRAQRRRWARWRLFFKMFAHAEVRETEGSPWDGDAAVEADGPSILQSRRRAGT